MNPLRLASAFLGPTKNLRQHFASKQVRRGQNPGFPAHSRGAKQARGRNNPPSGTRQRRRQISKHAGWRIRARGNTPRARRKARRALNETGHRHWIVQGAPRGRSSACTEARQNIGAHAKTGAAGAEPWTSLAQAQALREAFAGDFARAPARRPLRGNTQSAGAARPFRCAAPRQPLAARRSGEGRSHQGPLRPETGGAKSRSHASEAPQGRLSRRKRISYSWRRLHRLRKNTFVILSEAKNLSVDWTWIGREIPRFA
jgi:hypothetical protein